MPLRDSRTFRVIGGTLFVLLYLTTGTRIVEHVLGGGWLDRYPGRMGGNYGSALISFSIVAVPLILIVVLKLVTSTVRRDGD